MTCSAPASLHSVSAVTPPLSSTPEDLALLDTLDARLVAVGPSQKTTDPDGALASFVGESTCVLIVRPDRFVAQAVGVAPSVVQLGDFAALHHLVATRPDD